MAIAIGMIIIGATMAIAGVFNADCNCCWRYDDQFKRLTWCGYFIVLLGCLLVGMIWGGLI